MSSRFYIYCFSEGLEVVYVGKGSGRRLKQQEKRFGYSGKIIEYADDEQTAYRREVHWISVLRPTANKNAGGAGKIADPNPIPAAFRGLVSLEEWDRAEKQTRREMDRIERVGLRKYAAQLLLSKVDESNCERYGLSKVGVSRLREVANGPRC